MTIPAPNLYKKFGDPYKLVEFRVFSFNTCGAGCRNCFYQKTNNNFAQFKQVLDLANELESVGYKLETCYLQPTDVFENDFNYRIFEDESLVQVLNRFSYVGLATTLRHGFDGAFIQKLLSDFPHLKIEMHVNIIEENLTSVAYAEFLRKQFEDLKTLCGDRILINLALNTGTVFDDFQMMALKNLVQQLSHDRILELNFTFLFNKKMSKQKKSELMELSYPIIREFSREFGRNEQELNRRTLLRKPSFVFKDDQVFLSPILPFDEYVFIDESEYKLESPSFGSFLETYRRIEQKNKMLWPECEKCDNLEYCHGKGFFSVAQEFNLGCIKYDSVGG